jgi:hypothetical protein
MTQRELAQYEKGITFTVEACLIAYETLLFLLDNG